MMSRIRNETLLVEFVNDNFRELNLYSSLYKCIKIIDLGKENFTDGPDFINSTVSFDGKIEKGDIEIHLNSSSWYTHNHHSNIKYKDTILNICVKDDSKEGYNIYSNDKIIPVGCVSDDLFENYVKSKSLYIFSRNTIITGLCQSFHKYGLPEKFLQRFGMNRFYAKVKKFKNLTEKCGFDEAFYISVLEALGYVHNTAGFIKLATALTLSKIKGLYSNGNLNDSKDLYALYVETINSIVKTEGKNIWNTKSVYPKGTPLYKLKVVSPFIIYLVSIPKKAGFLQYWYSLYKEGKLHNFLGNYIKSPFGVKNIIFNVILPFFKIYITEFSNEDIYKYRVLPLNYLSRYALKRMIPSQIKVRLKKEIEHQGLIYLSKNYCSYGLKGCEFCPLLIEYTM